MDSVSVICMCVELTVATATNEKREFSPVATMSLGAGLSATNRTRVPLRRKMAQEITAAETPFQPPTALRLRDGLLAQLE